MIRRLILTELEAALERQAATALIGPRQVGKTTLALEIAKSRPSVYLDLESPRDLAKLETPELFFERNADKLIILDEIHRVPQLFQILRGVIDRARREGRRTGLFLLLGSAAIDLLRQSGETLAGRIAYVDMTPITALEVSPDQKEQDRLWVRGGFPDSLLAKHDKDSFAIREDFIRTYLERDVPQFGPRIPAETLRRLWTMLAHNQGQLLNASQLASSLSVSSPTITRYIDLLVDLLLVRRLEPAYVNVGKRLVKSPKLYVRDSGLLHALLGLRTLDEILAHPVVGGSWEGFVIETLVASAGQAKVSFYRTAAGAEVDLILAFGATGGKWVIEIKRGLNPKISKGMHQSITDLRPSKSFIIYGGNERYALTKDIDAIGLVELAELVQKESDHGV